MASQKNFSMSPAAQDLGLGDSLRQQLTDQEEERKRKMMQQAQAMQRQALGPATQTLFGGSSAAGGFSI